MRRKTYVLYRQIVHINIIKNYTHVDMFRYDTVTFHITLNGVVLINFNCRWKELCGELLSTKDTLLSLPATVCQRSIGYLHRELLQKKYTRHLEHIVRLCSRVCQAPGKLKARRVCIKLRCCVVWEKNLSFRSISRLAVPAKPPKMRQRNTFNRSPSVRGHRNTCLLWAVIYDKLAVFLLENLIWHILSRK